MIGQGHFDERLVGHVAFVSLDPDGIKQDGRHAQRDGLGGEFELRQRDAPGL